MRKGFRFRSMPQKMGGWVQFIPIALTALGMISDFVGGASAKDAAEKAAEKEAIAEGKVTAERIRQLEKQERTTAGETRAASAGARVKANVGSPLELLAEQASEFAQEKMVTRQVGASKAAQALQQGRDVGSAYKYRSYSNIAQGASNIFSIMSSSGMFSKGTNKTSMYLGQNPGPG